MRYTVGLDDKSTTIPLGRNGENNVTEIGVDISDWVEELGLDGTLTMWLKRSKDSAFYPVSSYLDGNILVHTLSSGDLQYIGKGEMGIIFTLSDGRIKKSRKFGTIVLAAVTGTSSEPPAPYQTWVEEVMAAAETAEDSATKAEAAVQHYPKIIDYEWYVWDVEQEKFVATGVKVVNPSVEETKLIL